MNKPDRLECSAILIQSSVELSPASFSLIFGRQAEAEQKAQTPTFLVGIILIRACLNPNVHVSNGSFCPAGNAGGSRTASQLSD
ncbi:Envelope glycoprotein US27 [Trichinella pseudospiralis]